MGRHSILLEDHSRLLEDHSSDPATARERQFRVPRPAREVHLDPRAREHITATLAAGRKLAAIRAYQRLTGAGFLAAHRAVGLWPTT